MDIRICEIDPNYTAFLHQFDHRVSLEHDDGGARKFLGIILEVDNKKYYAPMSSPKARHERISSQAPDVYKIDDGKLGIVNLNNMIPVPDCAVIPIDISTVVNAKYRSLLENQARTIKVDTEKISKKATRLYKMLLRPHTGQSLIDRCCNFKLLEEKSLEYKADTTEEKAP